MNEVISYYDNLAESYDENRIVINQSRYKKIR